VDDLRALLTGMTPYARETLRHVLVMDQPDRDVVAAELLRYRDSAGDEMADVIDLLTLYPEARRQVIRLLAEIDAAGA
jgi:hypothetical protein